MKFNNSEIAKTRCMYGQIFSTDRFYKSMPVSPTGAIAIDMETHYLYYLANEHERHALTINVVSDVVATQDTMTHEEKVTKTGDIVKAVLDHIV
jgi:purine-nucleoside phosphorylase